MFGLAWPVCVVEASEPRGSQLLRRNLTQRPRAAALLSRPPPQARQAAGGPSAAQAIAASVAAAGYDSDEEVYATAKALQAQGGDDDDDVPVGAAGRGVVRWLCVHVGVCPICVGRVGMGVGRSCVSCSQKALRANARD